ncbi:putative ABC transport system ATP-binding protein [Streptomyces sp. Amel2xB2]|uniref:ABC transporter ATP-binding protein n=1 Tax=Streptomyces sp. Amel2xB2 TaxID=1305829 RepID=UPI000DBAD8F8|nr:ATP-binding cassette domain-containing protein [Streptomyces sp. Amel2xB2]RAJ63508.1 putative ABC transport system ATP-binding protein [Streptomyces sp. Amel2xB2]
MAAPPDNDVLWARGLHYSYSGSPALQGVSIGVRAGEIVSVTGPRGSGKTTLLSCLSGQLTPYDGEIWFNSVPVHTLSRTSRERLRRDRFGWVGSRPQLVPELTAWENAALPMMLCGSGARAARKAAVEWLERLDVGDCARKRPAALRQSQRQRVAIARALVHAPAILFADEPTAPLHQAERAQVLRTLTTAARTHSITVVLATHDPTALLPKGSPGETEAADAAGPALADRRLTLLDGKLAGGPAAAGPGALRGDGPGDGRAATAGDGTSKGDSDGEDSKGAACSLSV